MKDKKMLEGIEIYHKHDNANLKVEELYDSIAIHGLRRINYVSRKERKYRKCSV